MSLVSSPEQVQLSQEQIQSRMITPTPLKCGEKDTFDNSTVDMRQRNLQNEGANNSADREVQKLYAKFNHPLAAVGALQDESYNKREQ